MSYPRPCEGLLIGNECGSERGALISPEIGV